MTYEDQVKNDYFDWLYNYICRSRINNDISYRKLFMLLHDTEFTFYVRNDFDRARDGIDLRYRFASLRKDDNIMVILDDACSVLEMILALAIRIEETIMDDPRYGDRTGQWFWGMLRTLGLDRMTDDRFDKDEANKKIYKFLERQYSPNGLGGLFYIKDCDTDLTQVSIWKQVCWYLDKFV